MRREAESRDRRVDDQALTQLFAHVRIRRRSVAFLGQTRDTSSPFVRSLTSTTIFPRRLEQPLTSNHYIGPV